MLIKGDNHAQDWFNYIARKALKKIASDKHNTIIIDISSPEEYQHEHMSGAINTFMNQVESDTLSLENAKLTLQT